MRMMLGLYLYLMCFKLTVIGKFLMNFIILQN